MRHAFTLIELIFVIVLIGILSGIGFYMSRSDTARTDAQYTLLKLKEARYRAIGYDALDTAGCVTLTEIGLENNTDTAKHDIKSVIIHTARNDMICFDALGRPHDMGYSINLTSLVPSTIDIVFRSSPSSDKNVTIRLFSQSGYAIILCNN